MKIKIELEANENLQDAEEELAKALKAKDDHIHDEKYADEHLNEFEAYVAKKHKDLIHTIIAEIKAAIEQDIKGKA